MLPIYRAALTVPMLLLAACGGGKGTTGTTDTTTTGTFVDSPVAGLYYSTTSGLSGKTGVGGTYSYKPGDTITFVLGKGGDKTLGAVLGTGTPDAAGRITPRTMTPADGRGANADYPTNLARMLQTLGGTDRTKDINLPADSDARLGSIKNVDFNTDDTSYGTSASNAGAPQTVNKDDAESNLNAGTAKGGDSLDFVKVPGGVWDVRGMATCGNTQINNIARTETYSSAGVSYTGYDGFDSNCQPKSATAQNPKSFTYQDVRDNKGPADWTRCLGKNGVCTPSELNAAFTNYPDGTNNFNQTASHRLSSGKTIVKTTYVTGNNGAVAGSTKDILLRFAHIKINLVGTTWNRVESSPKCLDGNNKPLEAKGTTTFSATGMSLTGTILRKSDCKVVDADAGTTPYQQGSVLPDKGFLTDLDRSGSNGPARPRDTFILSLTNALDVDASGILSPRGTFLMSLVDGNTLSDSINVVLSR